MITISCSWCRTMNPSDAVFCTECGHEAMTPRMLCKCPQCKPQTQETPMESASTVHTLDDMAAYLTARDAGDVVEVNEALYDHFFDIIPPVRFWQAIKIKGRLCSVDYGFAEGEEQITAFWKNGGRFFCQLSDEWNEGS